MADKYVDYALASGLNDGSSWANAYHTTTPTQNGLTNAGAGGRVFIKTDSSGTNTDLPTAGDLNYTSPGTVLNPTEVYGCKNGTTNEPPVTADLTSRGDTDIPTWGTTGSGDSVRLVGYAQCVGVHCRAGESLEMSGAVSASWVFDDCNIGVGQEDTSSPSLGPNSGGTAEDPSCMHFRNCDVDFGDNEVSIRAGKAGTFTWEGGTASVSGTGGSIDILFDNEIYGIGRIQGVNLTALGAITVVDLSQFRSGDILIENCEIDGSVSLGSGAMPGWGTRARLHNSSASTAISTSVLAFEEETFAGNISTETTRVRTGGADDGASGDFSWAMLPNASAVQFPSVTLRSPSMVIWLDGTETLVTVYIANDAAESSPANDMHDDEVWLEVWASDSTLDTAQYVLDSDRMAVLGTASDQANDAGSTWGSGANNHQKLVVTIAPGYEGWAMCYVHCAERHATPKTVYVDPLPELA